MKHVFFSQNNLGMSVMTGNLTSDINCHILSSLKENASLRNRARLNTIAVPCRI